MTIVWCDKSELKITSDVEPSVCVRQVLPSDLPEIVDAKKKKPYLNKVRIMWNINYLDTKYCFVIPKQYRWDGATIPLGFRWLIGAKGSPEFLVPSMVHDVMCENHDIIGNNRQLSSIIFRELLIASGVGRIRAYTMYYAVDNFQKLKFNGWGK